MAPIRILRRRIMHRGPVFDVVREQIKISGHRVEWDIIHHPGAAVILPMLGRSRIVFVRQYRRAAGRRILELPAGTLEPGEPPLACARRELREETGWTASRWRRLIEFYPAPGISTERMVLYRAEGLRLTGHAEPEAGEVLQTVILSVPEALARIRTREICDAKSILGVLIAAGAHGTDIRVPRAGTKPDGLRRHGPRPPGVIAACPGSRERRAGGRGGHLRR